MKSKPSISVLLVALACALAAFFPRGSKTSAQLQNQSPTPPAANTREEAYRANNIGVALLEQFKHREGAEAFRRALKLDPKLTLARINLSIALYNVPDLPAALQEARSAHALAPSAPQTHYILGLIARAQSRTEEAAASFQQVLKIDPEDVGANINLGQLYAQQRRYVEAVAAFRAALRAEPYNGTALYNLGTALLRTNQRDEGQRVMARFQELRLRGGGTTLGQNYLEQGRYAEAVASTGAEPELVERATPAVTFNDAPAAVSPSSNAASALSSSNVFGRRFNKSEWGEATRREIASALGGVVTPFDFDDDDDLDLFSASHTAQRLYRNDNGKFSDVTAQAGAIAAKLSSIPTGAVAGDYDNDGKADLFVIGDGALALYHNDGGGKFSDATTTAGLPRYPHLPSSVAFVDIDHDGDLDVFVAGLANLSAAPAAETVVFPEDFNAAPNLLLRNDGNGKFSDITAASKLEGAGHAVAVVPTDFNNRRDVDLLVLDYGKAPALFSNQRDGTFRNVAREVGLDASGRWTSAAAGDVNKDGFTDFYFGRADSPGLFVTSDGRERFKTSAAASETQGTRAASVLDYDDDGLLDCVMLTAAGLRVWRNVGDGWTDASARAVSAGVSAFANSRLFAAGDLDADGDTDLVALNAAGEVRLARNDGGNSNRSLRVDLTGRVSNRSGVGAKVETRAGSLVQKLETYAASPAPAPADVVFGLGRRASADAVRVMWPAGIVQAETDVAGVKATGAGAGATAATLPVIELDRKPSSYPYLYAWNGEHFEFITDFMGGGEMGHWEAPGRYNQPDPDE
ncbi:MAG TPA: FG-GAP-like repeat-containing protein, partial [Pyrinomonadaceae bacterium]